MLNLSRIQVALLPAQRILLSAVLLACLTGNSAVRADESECDKTMNAGMKALQEGRFPQAEKLLKDSLKMDEKQGATALKQDQATMVLADLYRSLKRFSEAEVLYKQLQSKYENSPSAAEKLPVILSKLAGVLKAEDKLENSLALYKKAFALSESREGPDSVAAATIHANIGLLYQRMGKLKEAEAEELAAIAMFKAKLGPDCAEAAQCMCDLAPQYMLERKNEQSIKILEQALSIYEKIAPDGLPYATCAEQLGNAYYSGGKFADAESLSRKAIEIYQKRLGPESKSLSIALTNLAGRLARQGKHQEALSCYFKSLAIQERAPETPAGMLANLHGITEVYVLQGNYKKAETTLRRDLAVREKKWGTKNASLLPALRNLAGCLIVEGAPQEEASMYLNRAEELLADVPATKRRMVADFVNQEMIKDFETALKKSMKKNNFW